VTVLPERVAGPLTTEYVIAPVDGEIAETANGAAPYVWLGIVLNASAVVAELTLKLVVATAAA
jgi:hypothetical protein